MLRLALQEMPQPAGIGISMLVIITHIVSSYQLKCQH